MENGINYKYTIMKKAEENKNKNFLDYFDLIMVIN